MFKDEDDYFDCLFAHYGFHKDKIDLICQDSKIDRETIIKELKKRKLM